MTALTQPALVLLLQSTGLLLLGLTTLHLTRKCGPAVQTLIGRAALVSIALLALLLPLTGHIQPVWHIGPPAPNPGGAGSEAQEPTPQRVTRLPSGSASAAIEEATRASADAKDTANTTRTAAPVDAAGSASTFSAATPPVVLTPRPSALHWQTRRAGGQALALRVTSAAPGGFLAVTAALLLWLAVCQWHLTRLRRTSQPITSGPALTLLASLTSNPPRLLTHPSVHSPFLAGLRRPVIFLPTTYKTDFDAAALRAVFVHELAHLARRDNFWTLAARLLCAVLWPQPLLWLLVRRLEQISEDACDEAVLAASCPPRAYADCLLSLASRPPLPVRQRTLNAGVAPYRSSLGRRINRILTTKGDRPMPAVTPRLRLVAAAVTVAAALGSAFLVSSAPAQTTAQTTAPAPFVPTPQELQYRMEQKQDLQNLKQIGLAIIQYTQDHNERMPDAAHWMDRIASYRRNPSVFYDPFQPGKKRYGYAFNRNCSGKPLFKFDAPASTVAVFDSTKGTRNASDTGQSLRINPPASSRINSVGSDYGFVDGHAKWFRPEVHPSFALDGGVTAASQPPANPSVVGTWLDLPNSGLGSYGLAGALVFHADGSMELIDTHPARAEAGHPYGSLQVVTHSYGRYTTAGPNLLYTLTRFQVEGKKPETIAPQEHRFIYSIGGDTLLLRWEAYKSISHRVPAYKPEMLGLKSSAASDLVIYASGNVRVHGILIHGILNTQQQRFRTSATPSAQLNQAQLLAGSTPVQGPGVIVTLTDSRKNFPSPMPTGMQPPNLIHDIDINQVVNELKAAGAEAIAVNGQRLVATSFVRSAGPTIFINNVPQAPPFVIKAIGDSKTLLSMLNAAGGISSQLKQFDPAMFSVQSAQTLTLPAYSGGSEPRYARPVGETAEAVDAPIQRKLHFLQAVRHEQLGLYDKEVDTGTSRQIKKDIRKKQEELRAQIAQTDALMVH